MRHIKKILVGCLACLWICQISAQPLPVLTGEWAPYTSEKLPQKGFFTALVRAAMEAASIEIELSFYPWPRDQFLIEAGQAFAAFPYAMTPERTKYAYFSDMIIDNKEYFFYKPAYNPSIKFNTLEDFRGYRVAGAKGHYYEEVFKAANLPVTYVHEEKDLVKLLELGKVDVVPMDELAGWGYIHAMYPQHAKEYGTLENPFNKTGLHLMVSKQFPDAEQWLKKFNEGLATIKQNGTYDALLKQWGPLSSPVP